MYLSPCILQGLQVAKGCSDAAHRAVRLGNPLIGLSKIDKADFAAVFDGNVSYVFCRFSASCALSRVTLRPNDVLHGRGAFDHMSLALPVHRGLDFSSLHLFSLCISCPHISKEA